MFNIDNNETDIQQRDNIAKIISAKTDEVIKDLSGGSVKHKQRVVDNLVAVVGASGGTGASTIVANLAYTIKQKGLTVLIIDLNIPYPIQQTYFRVKQAINKKDLVSFLLGKNSLGDSIESKGNISVLVSSNRNIMDDINCDNEVCSKNLDEAIEKIRTLFDMIIIDCPMNIQHDIINTMLYKADTIYSVWDENIACISNIERFRRNMALSGIEAYSKIKVIFNKRTNIHYAKHPLDKLNLEVIANFPFETAIIESALKGEIFCEKGASTSKNSAYYVNEMGKLADKVLEIGGYRK